MRRASAAGLRILSWRVALLAGVLALLEAAVRMGWIRATTMPPPSGILGSVLAIVPTARFRADAARSAWELALACGTGVPAGLAIGTAFALHRTARAVLEPWLVALYALPLVVFYPILMAFMGLGAGPVTAITAVMVAIPVALSTTAALAGVPPRLLKMALSVGCGPWRMLRSVVFPAAGPVLFSGIKMGFMYAIIGVVGMEFILSDAGVGFRIGYEYANFAVQSMWGHIGVVIVFSIAVVAALESVERRIRRDLADGGLR